MIVKLQGGLGNQLFQYAHGRTESLKREEPLFFDPSPLGAGNPPRRYGLGDYNINVEFRIPASGDEVLDGYWQGEQFFQKQLIRDELAVPKTKANDACAQLGWRMSFEQSCFIGVRRTDYLWPERVHFHGVLPMSYYEQARKRIPHGTKVYIFSDDPEWCREHFPYEVVTVNGEDEKHWDIWLMSMCKYAIIANSSFHWWGAWLSGHDRVIAPRNWLASQDYDIVPERWMTL